MAIYPIVHLKKREERRLRQGHLWIYSNEIDTKHSPLSQFHAGELVQFQDSQGKPLGLGYLNPHTLLCGRLLTRDIRQTIDQSFFEQRLQQALVLRTALYDRPFYRLVHGEGDGLPGLIVDRYGEQLVVQITTAGMELLREIIIAALVNVVQPKSILYRNDHGMRQMEGLPEYVTVAFGESVDELTFEENGVQFKVPAQLGQKTGWFYDHRENRAQLKRYVAGRRVLDLFSYAGGWSVQAAVFGASEVWAIDSSAQALSWLENNAILNNVQQRVRTLQGDAFDKLKELADNQEKFDVIILDPPAFIKKRKDHAQGVIGYQRINELALRLLNPGGFFISASCSQHLAQEELKQIILSASLKRNRELQILGYGRQAMDHPTHPAIAETEYLKAIFCCVK